MEGAFSLYQCSKDADIECFLKEKAIEFYKHGLCAVYLLVGHDELTRGILKIEAYFTLSHKALFFKPDTSKNKRTKAQGGFGGDAQTAHFVLIGQLGKYDDGNIKSEIHIDQIMESVLEIVNKSKELIPCNSVLIECKEDPKLIKVYEGHDFKFLQKDGLMQYFRKI